MASILAQRRNRCVVLDAAFARSALASCSLSFCWHQRPACKPARSRPRTSRFFFFFFLCTDRARTLFRVCVRSVLQTSASMLPPSGGSSRRRPDRAAAPARLTSRRHARSCLVLVRAVLSLHNDAPRTCAAAPKSRCARPTCRRRARAGRTLDGPIGSKLCEHANQ